MSLNLNGPIILAGAGKMGAALLSGWLARGVDAKSIIIQEPNLAGDAAAIVRENGLRVIGETDKLDEPASVIVVAVKPQIVDQAFPALAARASKNTVILSIAAGKRMQAFEAHLAPKTAVVRAMPNTPAAIGQGITGAVANAFVTAAQRDACDDLLRAVGEVVWLDDEGLIDAVTAVSGSGPAYVFLLAETLAEAGRKAGLDEATAMKLARATVSGSGELLRRSGDEPDVLRKNVTSPGGTTAAALAILMQQPGGLQDLMTAAIQAAKKRGRELGS